MRGSLLLLVVVLAVVALGHPSHRRQHKFATFKNNKNSTNEFEEMVLPHPFTSAGTFAPELLQPIWDVSVFQSGADPHTSLLASPQFLKSAGLRLGVTRDHLVILQRYATLNKVAMLIRLSEDDTVKLIEDGSMSTKSVDVHDKSSNWGPHRGTVPLDPFFNKKGGKASPVPNLSRNKQWSMPNPDILKIRSPDIQMELDHQHHLEPASKSGLGVIPLVISSDLLTVYTTPDAFGRIALVQADDCNCPGSAGCYRENINLIRPTAIHYDAAQIARFCISGDPTNGLRNFVTYCVEGDCTHPLYVWAYKVTPDPSNPYLGVSGAPLTGDYDMWMIAPHKDAPSIKNGHSSYFTQHTQVAITGGVTLCTEFVANMVTGSNPGMNLNSILGRDELRVFQHGAEMQNWDFVQPLDDQLLVILPVMSYDPSYGLQTGIVSKPYLPQLLMHLTFHGFFVTPNPRYDMSNKAYGGVPMESEAWASMYVDGELSVARVNQVATIIREYYNDEPKGGNEHIQNPDERDITRFLNGRFWTHPEHRLELLERLVTYEDDPTNNAVAEYFQAVPDNSPMAFFKVLYSYVVQDHDSVMFANYIALLKQYRDHERKGCEVSQVHAQAIIHIGRLQLARDLAVIGQEWLAILEKLRGIKQNLTARKLQFGLKQFLGKETESNQEALTNRWREVRAIKQQWSDRGDEDIHYGAQIEAVWRSLRMSLNLNVGLAANGFAIGSARGRKDSARPFSARAKSEHTDR